MIEVWQDNRWNRSPRDAVQDTAPGLLGSALLHGLALAAILLLARHTTQGRSPEPPFIPVDLVALGEYTTAPPAPAHAPAPQQRARQGELAAPQPEGVRPRSKRAPTDPLAARLQRLAKLHRPDVPAQAAADGASDMTASSTADAMGPAAYSVRDYIRAQVLRRWSLDLAKLGNRHMVIALHVRLSPKGALTHIAIVDQQRYRKDAVFRDIAISARNAVILSAPFKIPPGVARPALDFTMKLDPRDTLH